MGYIVNGDALIVMDELVKSGVKFDAIIADIPQKITRNDWDRPIPLKPMWELLYKLIYSCFYLILEGGVIFVQNISYI